MCPHWAHRRRWNHQPSCARHSIHPVPDGGTDVSTPSMLTRSACHPGGRRRNRRSTLDEPAGEEGPFLLDEGGETKGYLDRWAVGDPAVGAADDAGHHGGVE